MYVQKLRRQCSVHGRRQGFLPEEEDGRFDYKLAFKQFKDIFMDQSKVQGLCIGTYIYRFLIL
jgi:hypothetical protein